MNVRDIMSQPPVLITPKTNLGEAARLMIDKRIGCLPVVDAGGELLGIVTESDFTAKRKGVAFSTFHAPQLFGEWLDDKAETIYARAKETPVSKVMSTVVRRVDVDATLEEVLQTMLDYDVNRLPVTKGGQVVGVIARHDLMRLMLGP